MIISVKGWSSPAIKCRLYAYTISNELIIIKKVNTFIWTKGVTINYTLIYTLTSESSIIWSDSIKEILDCNQRQSCTTVEIKILDLFKKYLTRNSGMVLIDCRSQKRRRLCNG